MRTAEFSGQENIPHGRYLTFSLGSEDFGIDIRYVTEIIGLQPITAIPELPNFVKGIINLRDKIISVIDMRLRFNMKPAEYNDRTCVIIVELHTVSIGLIVDNVSEVLMVSGKDLMSPPALNPKSENRFISGIAKIGLSVKLILDCETIIEDIVNITERIGGCQYEELENRR